MVSVAFIDTEAGIQHSVPMAACGLQDGECQLFPLEIKGKSRI